jgi:hypothetical protein
MSLEERIEDNRRLEADAESARHMKREKVSLEMQDALAAAVLAGAVVEENADPVPGLMIDPSRGIALGGKPGGGRGYGGE